MGITIHYRGTLADTGKIRMLIEEMTDIAETLHWPYSVLDDDWSKPVTADIVHGADGVKIVGNLGLQGVVLTPHPQCEPLMLCFDAEGNLRDPLTIILLLNGELPPELAWAATKTHFAPPEVHVTLVKLLKYLQTRYMPDLEVHDEGEYWETSDGQILRRKRDDLNARMEEVARTLDAAQVDDTSDLAAEEMLTLIEDLLRKKFDQPDEPDSRFL